MAHSEPLQVLEALWPALRDHYPMMEYCGAHGAEWLEDARRSVASAPGLQEAYDALDALVCRLNDYHTRFIPPEAYRRADWGSPPVVADRVLRGRKELIAITYAGPETGVRPGAEVTAIDGLPVVEAIAQALLRSVGSTTGARMRAACWRMLLGPRSQPVRLSLRGNGKEREIDVPRDRSMPEEPRVACREVDGMPVIRITAWADSHDQKVVSTFDHRLEQYRSAPGLLIDVRGNGGGDDSMADQVTGRFLERPEISSISFHRQVPGFTFERTVEWAQPRGPWRYEGRVAVLIDEGCKSACEHFVSGMLAAGALLVGRTTDGACGWQRHIPLPHDAAVVVSRTFPLHGKTPSPRHGIVPHLPVPIRLEDLRRQRDATLIAASRRLQDPVPPHPQRLSDPD